MTQTIKRYEIFNNRTGLCLGVYQGRDKAEALDSLAFHAGFPDYAEYERANPTEPGDIIVQAEAVTEAKLADAMSGQRYKMPDFDTAWKHRFASEC